MSRFSLHDLVRFGVEGRGPLPDYLRMQYASFEVEGGADPELQIRIAELAAPTSPPLRLKGDGAAYLRDGPHFIWERSGAQVAMEGSSPLRDLARLSVEPGFPRMDLNRLLEFRFRLPMLEAGVALVHASCLSQGKSCMVFPAWKATGKTSLCLTLLARGHGFLSDDRIWLRRDGHALAYPRYLVINASNAGDFPELLDSRARFAHGAHRALETWGLPAVVSRIAGRLLPRPVRYFTLGELFPDAPTPPCAEVSQVVFVVRDTRRDPAWDELDAMQMSALVRSVGDFEWNAELVGFTAAHDVLFPEGPSWREELRSLVEGEGRVLAEALSRADCARLRLPCGEAGVAWEAAADAVEARATGG